MLRTLALLLLLSPPWLRAETLAIPLHIDFPLLRQLLEAQLFRGASASTELLHDPNGCSEIVLSDPTLSEADHYLQIDARLSAKLAVKLLDRCMPVLTWDGYAQIISQPKLKEDNPRLIYLHVVDSHLVGLDKQRLTSGALWNQVRKHLHPLFERFRLDMTPSIDELRTTLPLFLPRHSSGRLNQLLDSIHLTKLRVNPDGVAGDVMFTAEAADLPEQPEHVLSEQEQLHWQQKWQSMDALLTHAIKHYAAATELAELRQALFEVLIDARYRLQDALRQDRAEDPVRHWFLDSWTRLMPLLRQVSGQDPRYATTALLSLIAAGDVLRTLDQLGPSVGLDISMDGLRRLARMLSSTQDVDPLRYDDALDPELLRLFQFEPPPESNNDSRINLWPLATAVAAENPPLASWLPKPDALDSYLERIRSLLLEQAERISTPSSLSDAQRILFKKLVMATAWQESCWRQYVVERNKIVPLRSSTGDIGIMQINERVWRGFVDLHKLRWDIAYNVQSGSRILINYLTRYALTKGEHTRRGGLNNLARAAYSAYNGGPGQIARYRNERAPKAHRQIDRAFYEKFLSVDKGKEMAVAECLSPEQGAASRQATQSVPAPATGLLHDETWIKQQAQNHLTLQLGVFSSLQSAAAFIKQLDVPGEYAVYRQGKNKPTDYAVIYGHYPSRREADNGRRRFKTTKPWIRTFQEIRTANNF